LNQNSLDNNFEGGNGVYPTSTRNYPQHTKKIFSKNRPILITQSSLVFNNQNFKLMGKVIVLISTTLDGFADGQNVIVEPEFFEFTHSLMSVSEAVGFGRNTFEQFQERWPLRLKDENSPAFIKRMAQALHDIQKVVFSSTLKTTTWHNSKIENKLDVDYIKSFKNSSKGGLLTFGSLSLVESLIEINLVDDYYFNIQPLIPGKGETRFFSKMNLSTPLPLKYIDSKPLASGAHIIHYQSVGTAQ
jgi:dihydrofolate reductase